MRDGLGSLRVKPGSRSVYRKCAARATKPTRSLAHTKIYDKWKPATSAQLVRCLIAKRQLGVVILVHGDS